MPELSMPAGLRKTAGYAMLALSCVAWIGVPVVPFLEMATSDKLVLAGGLYLASQITWLLCLALMGPEILQLWRAGKARLVARLQRNQS